MMDDELKATSGLAARPASDLDAANLPVIARLIVEVRSDGRRTVARGQVEDLITGQRTEIAARGDSPAALLASLWRSMSGIATLARRAVRALAPRRDA
jgi:hypothetical protein